MIQGLVQLFPELSLVFLSFLSLNTKQSKYSQLLAGGVMIIFIGAMMKKLAKRLPMPRDILKRPKGARDCNQMQKGLCEDEMGMPSIHSMLAGFYFAKTKNAALIAVPLSRLRASDFPVINHGRYGCHTWLQISVGFTLGFLIGRAI